MIQNDLKKLGIKVNYQPIDFNALIDKTSNSLDWEAMVMGLTGSRLEPYDGANVWKSNGAVRDPGAMVELFSFTVVGIY